MTARKGDWMHTFSGARWWPMSPRPRDFQIGDIAHSLALKNRFGGHSLFPVSVALHSVNTSLVVHPTWAREALMHDAPEAVVGDMIRPIKFDPSMASFKDIEALNWQAIAARFALFPTLPREVKRADSVMLVTEASQALNRPSEGKPWWEEEHWPALADITVEEVSWQVAKDMFLTRFYELFPEER